MTFPSYDRHHSTYPCADHREDDGKDDAKKKKERREGEGREPSTARELFDTTRLVWFLIFSLSLLFCRQREKNYASYMCGCGVCVWSWLSRIKQEKEAKPPSIVAILYL